MKYLGHIIGILGILLGCFFYLRSLSDPELVYYVDPAKLTVVRAGQSSKIIVKIDGDTVERDVTAAQIYIWNKGEDSIRKENLLSPLRSLFKTPIGPLCGGIKYFGVKRFS